MQDADSEMTNMSDGLIKQRSVCVWVCVCGHVYVVYEDTNLYNDIGMT